MKESLFFSFVFLGLFLCCYFNFVVLFCFFFFLVFAFYRACLFSFFSANREEEERYVAPRGELCGLRSKLRERFDFCGACNVDSKRSVTHNWWINWVILPFSVIPASSASY